MALLILSFAKETGSLHACLAIASVEQFGKFYHNLAESAL